MFAGVLEQEFPCIKRAVKNQMGQGWSFRPVEDDDLFDRTTDNTQWQQAILPSKNMERMVSGKLSAMGVKTLEKTDDGGYIVE
mgnify:CR=1